MNTIPLFLALTVFLAAQHTTNALACYSCDSLPSCWDPFNPAAIGVVTFNSSSAIFCTKTIYRQSTQRGYSTTCDTPGRSSYAGSAYSLYCCSTDYCNSVHQVGSSSMLITATIAYLLFSTRERFF